jgi:3-oxoadipate enol-lactonase
VAAVADTVIGRWFTPAFRTRQPDLVGRMKALLLATPPEGYGATCDALAAMDLRDDLAQIKASTLVIAAAEDQATPAELSHEIARRIQRAEVAVIAEAAHIANLEQPEIITNLIMNHVQS